MGWQDRDYSTEFERESAFSRAGLRWPARGALLLMALHGTAFLCMLMMQEQGGAELTARLELSDKSQHPVGILLAPLATSRLGQLLFTLLSIWFVAGAVEERCGLRRMWSMYVVGNLAAALAFFVVARLYPPLASDALNYPWGAVVAWGFALYHGLPDEPVSVFGRMMPLAHVLGIVLAVVVVLQFMMHQLGAVAWLASGLAAAGAAWLTLARPRLFALPQRRAARRRAPRRVVAPAARAAEPRVEPPVTGRGDAPDDIDDLLAKISRSGIASLTSDERQRLEAARQARLRRSEVGL